MSILLRTVRLIPRPASIVSRQISSEHKIDPSDDLNHVILLGTVNGVNRATDPGKNHVSISLRTRDVYRAAKGYGMKVVSHRIQVFNSELIKKALQLNKGDRVCIHGNLGSYPMDLANKVWLQCVVARSICLYHNPPDAEDHEEQLSHEDEAKTYTSSPKASWDSGFESPKGSSS